MSAIDIKDYNNIAKYNVFNGSVSSERPTALIAVFVNRDSSVPFAGVPCLLSVYAFLSSGHLIIPYYHLSLPTARKGLPYQGSQCESLPSLLIAGGVSQSCAMLLLAKVIVAVK